MKKIFKWITLGFAALMTCATLVACTPSSIDGAKEKLKEKGYTVLSTNQAEDKEGCIGGFTATSIEGFEVDNITAFLFDTKKDAEAFYNDADALNSIFGNDSVILKGKWVYFGTEDAIEDFNE